MSMMEELTFFLRLHIKQTEKEIFINQSKYTRKILKKFEMENAKGIGAPMSPTSKHDQDENSKYIDSKFYRGVIESLFYLTINQPNIMFSICMCTRYQSNPKKSHISTIKKILEM